MSGSDGWRDALPWPVRALLVCVRGAGAEFVVGDLEEAWRAAAPDPAARRAWLRDALVTVLRWWSPRAVSHRIHSGRPARAPLVADLGSDVLLALRMLWRRPGFAGLVIATLALGIAATTTIYGVVDAVVVRALPYPAADRLVSLGTIEAGASGGGADLQPLAGASGPDVRAWRERVRTLSAIEAVEFRMNLVPDQGEGPRVLPMPDVTPGFLPLLGARLALGRAFQPEDLDAADRVVILSHAEWRNRAGADPGILGRAAPGLPGTRVVGVLAPGFVPPEALFGRERIDHFRVLDLRSDRYAAASDRRLLVIGRRHGGATLADVRTELLSLQATLAREDARAYTPPDGAPIGAGANDLRAATVGTAHGTLMLFLAASLLLLLIAAFNAASLLLVRGLDRENETAVRLALGADRWRVVRGVLVESIVLSLLGGAAGALIAWGGVAAFVQLVPPSLPRLSEVALNGRVLVFCALVSMGIGVAAGLVPARMRQERGLATTARSRSTTARAGLRVRTTLVAAQLALAVVLGVGALLLFRSFVAVSTDDPGFTPAGLIAFPVFTKRGPEAPATAAAIWDELLTEVRTIPGLRAAAASALPFQPPDWMPAMRLPGDAPAQRRTGAAGYVVTPDYFGVMEIAVRAGRSFDATDRSVSRPVAIVNAAFEQRLIRTGTALGTTVAVWNEDGTVTEREVVGVVASTTQARPEDGHRPALYVPYTQVDWPTVHVVVRSARDPAGLAPELRAAALRFNPIVPAPAIEPFASRIRRTWTEPRFQAFLFVGFAAVAVLLAAVGLYGTLAHAVAMRTRELGIRIALGADAGSILAMVLRQGMVVFALGLLPGMAAALSVAALLRGFLFGVSPLDPVSFAAIAVLLGAVAAAATLRPALRATAVDPIHSLRGDG